MAKKTKTKGNASVEAGCFGQNQSTRSFGHHVPPPPPPASEPPFIIPDVGLNISQSMHARYDQRRTQAPTAARIQRPGVAPGMGMSNYQRAKSARILPTAPPPPPPSMSQFGNQSIAAIGGRGKGLSMSMHAPSTTISTSASNKAMARSSSSRMMASPPPPPPPPPTSAALNTKVLPPPLPPPSTTPPEDLLLAEGVPVAVGNQETSAAAAAPPPSPAEKPKKKKKKVEGPPEVFEDEPEDVSESEHEEALTAEEKAEKTEKEVKKTLCFAILNACGLIFMISLISKLLQRSSNAEYTGEDEFINAAGTNVGGGPTPPPPVGAEAAVNTGIAQQMTVAASQTAAASSAAGATSAATVAAAATAATVTVTSTVGVVGFSAVAVTGVGMATGIVPVPNFLLGKPACQIFLDELIPHKGHVNLHLKDLPPSFFNNSDNTPAVEMAFTEAFNKVLGTCVAYSVEEHYNTASDSNNTEPDEFPQDVYARFLQSATLEDWTFWSVVDNDKPGERIKYFTTEWSANVGCGDSNGCSDFEPLFYDKDMKNGQTQTSNFNKGVNTTTARRQLLLTDPMRWLEDITLSNGKNKSNLKLFMDSFARELEALLEKSPNPDPEPKVFYGASLAANDTNTVVESEGVKYEYGNLLDGKGEDGRPMQGLPVCDVHGLQFKEGYFHISLQGIEEEFFKEKELSMRDIFRSVYNDLMLGCKGGHSRVLEQAELVGVTGWEEQGRVLLSTNWSAIVTCAGCSDIEPLFFEEEGPGTNGNGNGNANGNGNGKPASASKGGGAGRQLEIVSESRVAKFANAFAAEVTKLYQTQQKPDGVVKAYYAAPVDSSGTVVGDEVGERQPFGNKHDGLVDCATGQPPENIDDLEEGKFELLVKDLVKDMNRTILEAAMQDIYNEITGMCDGPMQRVAHRLTIDNMEQVIVDDSQIFVGMNMTAKLTCNGCENSAEPMFGEGEQGASRHLQPAGEAMFERFQSKLTTQINLLLADYENTPYYEEGVPLFQSTYPTTPHKPVDVVYGATYDKSGKVTRYGTPVHHNIFSQEELRAGPDVIVQAEDCERDLVAADAVPRDHGLKEVEFFVFVKSLFALVSPTLTWPELGGFGYLPVEVQEIFDKFQQGGIMYFGEKNAANEARRKTRVEAICYYASHATKDYIKGLVTEAPTTVSPMTSAPTTQPPTTVPPTPAPTNTAPTTVLPKSAPSEAPTSSPAPTETRLVEINVEWMLKLDPKLEVRDATEDEYNEFASRASTWLTETMNAAYDLDTSLNFESQRAEFTTSQYEPATPEIVVTTKSFFVFRGTQPTPRSVFEMLNQQDLVPFLESLWVDDNAPNKWIFDNAVGLTVATARQG